MKEDYKWDYTIRIKTKEGTYEYEKENLQDIELLLEKHPGYESIEAVHKDTEEKPKRKAKKRW